MSTRNRKYSFRRDSDPVANAMMILADDAREDPRYAAATEEIFRRVDAMQIERGSGRLQALGGQC